MLVNRCYTLHPGEQQGVAYCPGVGQVREKDGKHRFRILIEVRKKTRAKLKHLNVSLKNLMLYKHEI